MVYRGILNTDLKQNLKQNLKRNLKHSLKHLSGKVLKTRPL